MNKKMILYGGIGVFIGLLFFIVLETPVKAPSTGTYIALIISTLLLCIGFPVFLEGVSDNEKGNIFSLIALWVIIYLGLIIKLEGIELYKTAGILAVFVVITFLSQQYGHYIKTKKLRPCLPLFW